MEKKYSPGRGPIRFATPNSIQLNSASMKLSLPIHRSFSTICLVFLLACAVTSTPAGALAQGRTGTGTANSGGGGGGGPRVDSIKFSKCFYSASNGAMLISASSSNPAARLFAYLPDGTFYCEVVNGGGNRYGGTVFYIGRTPARWCSSAARAAASAPQRSRFSSKLDFIQVGNGSRWVNIRGVHLPSEFLSCLHHPPRSGP